jgi:hypothetical protein
MKDLIEALQIFLKYGNPHSPTHCEHDELTICSIEADKVSAEDKARLEELGFHHHDGDDHFMSFRFGSC